MSITRSSLLHSLLALKGSVPDLNRELVAFGWDSPVPLATLTTIHVRDILQRYLEGSVSPVEVENWANAIESRDDISYESGHEQLLTDALHELANPTLSRPLRQESARYWLERLLSGPGER